MGKSFVPAHLFPQQKSQVGQASIGKPKHKASLLFSFWHLSLKDAVAAKKPPPPKPKRCQKAGERLTNSRKKLRKEDGVKSNEALMKQLKQVHLAAGTLHSCSGVGVVGQKIE